MEPEGRDTAPSDRSIAMLFRQLSRELGTLLRQESELARAEIRQKAAQIGNGISELGAGALIGFAGFLILLQAAVYALADAFDSPALAALLVGAVTAAIGAAMVGRGRSHLKAEKLTPERTVASLREDAEMVRHGGQLSDEPPYPSTSADVQQRSH
jgi:Putative Actinobacterial Holin-X, holin superfamily III